MRHCLEIAEVFPDIEIVHALRGQLTWTHLKLVIRIQDPLKRNFYIEMCKLEKWSTRVLGNVSSQCFTNGQLFQKSQSRLFKMN